MLHVVGHIENYSQLLTKLKQNDTFRTAVEHFEEVECDEDGRVVSIGDQSVRIYNKSDARHGRSNPKKYLAITEFVAPRTIRKTEQLENSLIGRCMSGK